jgi:response regulator of citrate/malate metabolism
LVELLYRYSNRQDLLKPLVDVVRRIRENDQTEEPGLTEPHNVANGGRQTVAERLCVDGLQQVAEQYRSGVTARELAEKYEISRSSIKRILRNQGARRR